MGAIEVEFIGPNLWLESVGIDLGRLIWESLGKEAIIGEAVIAKGGFRNWGKMECRLWCMRSDV